jgi:hypothetical protein
MVKRSGGKDLSAGQHVSCFLRRLAVLPVHIKFSSPRLQSYAFVYRKWLLIFFSWGAEQVWFSDGLDRASQHWCLFLPQRSDAPPSRPPSTSLILNPRAAPLLRSPMTVRHSFVSARVSVFARRPSYAPTDNLAQASTSSEQPTTGLPSTILRMNGSPSIALATACARPTLRWLVPRPRGGRRPTREVKDFNEQQNVVFRPMSARTLHSQ